MLSPQWPSSWASGLLSDLLPHSTASFWPQHSSPLGWGHIYPLMVPVFFQYSGSLAKACSVLIYPCHLLTSFFPHSHPSLAPSHLHSASELRPPEHSHLFLSQDLCTCCSLCLGQFFFLCRSLCLCFQSAQTLPHSPAHSPVLPWYFFSLFSS